jgi:D-amino-acid dehydrogenase
MMSAQQQRAAIVGAGVVGLSVAWFLQQAGFEVTVFDRTGVAAGASAGNAGWLTPGMVAPLPEPAALRYGLASLFRPASPLRITPAALPSTWRFLLDFAAHCTRRQWLAGISRFAALNAQALTAYRELAEAGVPDGGQDTTVTAAFDQPGDAAALRHELQAIAATGLDFSVDELSASELHREQPLLSERATFGLRVGGQQFLQPLAFVQSLARSVTGRGGELAAGTRVTAVTGGAGAVQVAFDGQDGAGSARFDVCVLATGAWLGDLARAAGVRVRVLAGRGYSLAVPARQPLSRPLYLPAARVACTPHPGGLRLAGTMEFRPADDPLDKRRIRAIVRSVREYLPGADWAGISGSWVGARPVTADGLPVIGATKAERVYVAGGHGMWGMTLGPATGRALARLIESGRPQPELTGFDPLR